MDVRVSQWAAVDYYTDLLLEHDKMAGAFADLGTIPELWDTEMDELAAMHEWAIGIVRSALTAEAAPMD